MALTDNEALERERLLQLQANNQRWFSQEEFERLTYLSKKMFENTVSPYIKTITDADYSAESLKFKGFNATDRTVNNRKK
jgi:DNA-binding transcriptional regulator YhcF (GntR family)